MNFREDIDHYFGDPRFEGSEHPDRRGDMTETEQQEAARLTTEARDRILDVLRDAGIENVAAIDSNEIGVTLTQGDVCITVELM